jgi:thiol:disulfide interchange protein DsbD
MRKFKWLCVVCFIVGLTGILATSAQASAPKATVAALWHAPGEIVLDVIIPDGLHAQSHTPAGEGLIPFTISFAPSTDVTLGSVQYPPGEDVMYPGLGKENVYTGHVVFRVPATLNGPAGGAVVSGSVRYQACNDKACFPPTRISFEVKVGTATGATTAPLTTQATAQTTNASPPPAPRPAPAQFFGLQLTDNAYVLAFAAAFVIGMIFNVMPCVLPVVPLKIIGFYEVSQHDRRKSMLLGAVFSAGLIASFGVLAILIVGLKKLDWGGLFQQQWFTLTISLVLIAMAASMFGFFTVNLPGKFYALTPRHDTYTGNFLFGVLTAALSTPCTFGMFVGLLAWALAQPAVIGVAVLMTVGVGMAFPYFVLSAFPEAARNFPRTGAWAAVVKQMLGFLLLATAVYFALPLYERFVSEDAFWWTMFAVIASAGVFLVFRTLQISTVLRTRAIAFVLALLLIVPALFATVRLTSRPFEWVAYSDDALADARRSGRPVLIDFTATWCGNCHYIEAFVLHDPSVIRAVREHHVVMIKADVTHEDAPGTALLDKLNAARAIPLTALFAPGDEQPQLLDGIYSSNDLLRLLGAS